MHPSRDAIARAYYGLGAAPVLAQFEIKPDGSKAPGSSGLQEVINGIAFYALLAAGAGFLIGAAAWAVGGRVGNDHTASQGKMGMVVAAGAAFLVGAAATILNFAYDTGSSA